jgi:hypothetical protein
MMPPPTQMPMMMPPPPFMQAGMHHGPMAHNPMHIPMPMQAPMPMLMSNQMFPNAQMNVPTGNQYHTQHARPPFNRPNFRPPHHNTRPSRN